MKGNFEFKHDNLRLKIGYVSQLAHADSLVINIYLIDINWTGNLYYSFWADHFIL